MRVTELMKREVDAVGPDTPLGVAARRMRDDDVGSLMVVEGGRLAGVLTDRDIVVRALAEGSYHERLPVRRAMSIEVVACFEDQTVEEAERLMAEHGVRRLPVLDRGGRLVGVLSRSDIAGAAAGHRAHRVTFYKRLATGYGEVRNVPQCTVYVSDCRTKEDAAAAAVARFQAECGARSWGEVADGYEVIEPGG